MVAWRVHYGLAVLLVQWRRLFPKAVIGTIGDKNHDPNSGHSPKNGVVRAGDFMKGSGVDDDALDRLCEQLRVSRDGRIKYVIRRQRIFAGNDGPVPWVWRTFTGDYHSHAHVEVEDDEADRSAWDGIGGKAPIVYEDVNGTLPVLLEGMSDPIDSSGTLHIKRAQELLDFLTPGALTVDGDYGPKTTAAVKTLGYGNGKRINKDVWAKLIGLRQVRSTQ